MPRPKERRRTSKRKGALAIESRASIADAAVVALPAARKSSTAMNRTEATRLTLKGRQARLPTQKRREGRARGNQRDRAATERKPPKARRVATLRPSRRRTRSRCRPKALHLIRARPLLMSLLLSKRSSPRSSNVCARSCKRSMRLRSEAPLTSLRSSRSCLKKTPAKSRQKMSAQCSGSSRIKTVRLTS